MLGKVQTRAVNMPNRIWKIAFGLVAAAPLLAAATQSTKKSTSKTTAKKSSSKKKYRSSVGQPDPQAAAAKKSPVKTVVKKIATAPVTAVKAVRRRVVPHAPPVSAKTRAEAHEAVFMKVATGADIPLENAG